MNADNLKRFNLCPKWGKCNAPICPLDSEWEKRSLHSEDASCFYLTELVKDGAQTRFQGAGLGELFEACTLTLPKITERHARLRRALERSASKGSRMDRRIPSGGGDECKA